MLTLLLLLHLENELGKDFPWGGAILLVIITGVIC